MAHRANLQVVALAFASGTVLLTACNVIPIVTGDDQVSITSVRAFKNTLSPAYNRPFGIFLREANSLLSYGLPSQFGVDLTPFFQPFPAVQTGQQSQQIQVDKDPGTGELRKLFAGTQLEIDSQVQAQDANTYVYTLTVVRTPTGTAGQLAVTTAGTSWYAPPGGGQGPYLLNRGQSPQVINTISANAQINLPQSAGQVQLQASLGAFIQAGHTTLPRTVNLDLIFPGFSANLQGTYQSAQAVHLTGPVSITSDRLGNDTYQMQLDCSRASIKAFLINEARKFRIDLTMENGVLNGTAKTSDWRAMQLASFSQTGNGPIKVDFADGGHETWNMQVPTN